MATEALGSGMLASKLDVVAATDADGVTVQSLAESEVSLRGVPGARFVRSPQELASYLPRSSMCLEPIPMIDLEGLHDFRRQFTMAAISSACRHWGCFQVVNHEVPQSVLDGALEAAREFFAMPFTEKQALMAVSPKSSGYGMQSAFEVSEESDDRVLDWGDVVLHKNMDTWPVKPATYKNALESCARGTRKVLEMLLDVISKELRLAPTYSRTAFGEFEQPLRVNYYPPCPHPELVLGLRPHTDPVVLTAVLEDQTGGLQVKHGDKWVPVDPDPDALVIFIGDQLQISSNGRCKAVSHRTVVNQKTARISIAMGLAPSAEVRVSPATELVEKSAPARYEARTYAEFRASLPSDVRWDGEILQGQLRQHVRRQERQRGTGQTHRRPANSGAGTEARHWSRCQKTSRTQVSCWEACL